MTSILPYSSKHFFIALISVTTLVDIAILLEIPILREFIGFLYIALVPGILIIQILKLNNINFLKVFVYSTGLSVFFAYFIGTLVNNFYPYISKPLSIEYLLMAYNIIIAMLAIIAYVNTQSDFSLKDYFYSAMKFENRLYSPLLLSILFPLMAIFGTYLMNIRGDNTLLLIFLFLIPLYVASIFFLDNKITEKTYPVSIWMIGLSLLLMHGLTSNYIKGSDIHGEFYVFKLTLNNLYWDIEAHQSALNSILSVTILPVIYKQFTGVNDHYIYKLLFPLVFSVIPLGLYCSFQKYISKRESFIACLFFVSQGTFIFELIEHARQGIAFLFFTLAIMVFFDDEIDKLNRKVLLIIFTIGIVLSHYATAYAYTLILIFSWLSLLTYNKLDYKNKKHSEVTLNFILLLLTIVILWYGQITKVPFKDFLNFIIDTFTNLTSIFLEDSRDKSALNAIGIGIQNKLAYQLFFWIRNVTLIFMLTGTISCFTKYCKIKLEAEYRTFMLSSIFLVALMIILPFVSSGYGITRLYLQTLIILAPFFVVGGKLITINFIKMTSIKKLNANKNFILVPLICILLLQNICATTLIFNISNIPYSEDLNTEGDLRNSLYICDQEVKGAKWLAIHKNNNTEVNVDFPGFQRIQIGYISTGKETILANKFYFYSNKSSNNEYIYLRSANVLNQIVYPSSIYAAYTNVTSITNYSHLLDRKNKIYNNRNVVIKY